MSRVSLPSGARDLLDAHEFATVATLEPDGRPQLSVVWVKRDGDDVLFSTVRSRRKASNLERDPRCTLLVFPRGNPYSYLELRGAVEITDDPTSALIEELNGLYTGREGYGQDAPGDERIVVRLRAERVVFHG